MLGHPCRSQANVDESRAGDLERLAHALRVSGQMVDDLLRQVAGLGPESLGQAHGDVALVIAESDVGGGPDERIDAATVLAHDRDQ